MKLYTANRRMIRMIENNAACKKNMEWDFASGVLSV
jgi:hypothetical protein